MRTISERQIFSDIRRALVLLESGSFPVLAAHDLSLLQFDTLRVLADGSGLRMGVLADRLLCDDSTLTRAVDHLIDRRWASRRPDPADRRAALVSITEAGRKHHRSAQLSHDEYLASSFAGIADPTALTAALSALVAGLDERRGNQ